MAKASVTATRRARYDEDLYAWTQEQAALLRARHFDALDWENLAEEIAAVGGSDRRKLESRPVRDHAPSVEMAGAASVARWQLA